MLPLVQQLLSSPPGGSEFGPQLQPAATRDVLKALKPGDLVTGDVADSQMAEAALAGLWLRHGFLDQSHNISQSLETAEGSYWHGIMHRREPDYGNATYWFRRVGKHAVFSDIARRLRAGLDAGEIVAPDSVREIVAGLADVWDPFAFVDLSQQAARGGDADLRAACEAIANVEWQALFEYCLAHASSGG